MIAANTEIVEVTGRQQVGYLSYDNVLTRSTTDVGTFAQLRALRKDATVALGRGLLVSGIKAGSWSVESDEGVSDEIIDFVAQTFLPLREKLMQAAVAFGRVDYGFMPFEKIFAIKNGRLVITEFKQLLVDITTILIDTSGRFAGFRQNTLTGTPTDVPLEQSLLINFDVEAANLYGYPLLENIRAIQTMWTTCNDGATRYDTKIAGAHWLIHYPPGTTTVDDVATDNYDIAMSMLAALESSGSIVVPSTVAEYVQELNRADITKLYTWDVTLITSQGTRQSTFVDRLKYLDSLKIRGLILPERSMLEGSYGTLAEAQSHVGLAVTNMQSTDRAITQMVNDQVVNQLLAINWGLAPGTVRLVAAPLVDLDLEFLRKLYLALGNKQIDIVALQESLNIPFGEKPEEEITNVTTNVTSED